jgi:two-component system, NarL family, response regulator LiaR
MDNRPIQVLVVDDHAMVRKGLKALLNGYEDIRVIGEAANGLEAIELAQQLKPDLVLMDLLMPGMDGIEATQQIIAVQPEQRILVLTGFAGHDCLAQAIQAGALGYLRKDVEPAELVQSIRIVCAGEPSISSKIAWQLLHRLNGAGTLERKQAQLTERELEVLRLLGLGYADQEIAEQLFITDVTVRTHLARIFMKLGLSNRVQAALYSFRSGLVSIYETSDEALTR